MLKPKSKQRPWDRIKPITQPVITRARDEFYHTSRWKKESRAFRQQYPLCAACSRDGLIVPAEVTDHVIPKNICADPWDKKNWEPLCKKCHAKKGARDKKHFKK